MGTPNFDLLFHSTGDLLVSNVDFNNHGLQGKFEYQANGFAQHRISRVTPTGGSVNGAPTVIDLNVNLGPGLGSGYSCAVPNQMALASDGQTLYVACYESHNVAVVNLGTGLVEAELTANPMADANLPFGARGVLLNETGGNDFLYVYYRGNNQLAVFDPDAPTPLLGSQLLGYDITPKKVQNGRFHFINAKNSFLGATGYPFGTGSCNTCHIEGHLDGMAWDLSEFTGALSTAPFPREINGIKVTMSLRGIEETPPFHWRGNRADLADFDGAFEGLLGGQKLSAVSAAALEELDAFVFSLAYPPNPNQAVHRGYSGEATKGFGCFLNEASFATQMNETGTFQNLACDRCHSMAGFSGTNNQVNFVLPGEIGDATTLRGLFDKESDVVAYDATSTDDHPASGFGFTNYSNVNTLEGFIGNPLFDLSATRESQIVKFLREMDTGMAPTTAYAVTLDGTNNTPGEPDPQVLITAANAGHRDLIARGLLPGQTMTLEIETEDPASSPNTHTETLFLTPQGRLFQSVHVEEARLDVGSQNGDGTYPLTTTFKIVDAAGSPVSGADVKFWVVEWPKPSGKNDFRQMNATAPGPNPGEVTKGFDSMLAGGTDVFAEIFVENVVDVSGNRFYFHPLAGEFGYFDQQPLP